MYKKRVLSYSRLYVQGRNLSCRILDWDQSSCNLYYLYIAIHPYGHNDSNYDMYTGSLHGWIFSMETYLQAKFWSTIYFWWYIEIMLFNTSFLKLLNAKFESYLASNIGANIYSSSERCLFCKFLEQFYCNSRIGTNTFGI